MHSRWLYARQIISDGNFKLEHMNLKNQEDDVFLNKGSGYLADPDIYGTHIANSTEVKEVCLFFYE
jgi:hypothetical protein